ncbi:MAG: CoA pyrophosphatase [Candidatus Eremiobacteraeota bacterium]|nr:CoA pyrophosphatase [Candidatus Eremiobacteraeota bacterium]
MPITSNLPPSVLFVQRAQHLRRHPGQNGFPGGIEEPGDRGDPVTTALRELSEELGVGAERVKIVGRLPDVRQGLNRFIITPIVGVLAAPARFSLDENEIVDAFFVPLSTIVADGALAVDHELTKIRGKAMYALNYEGRRIWGFTAQILKSFVDAWNAPASSLRRAVNHALAAS